MQKRKNTKRNTTKNTRNRVYDDFDFDNYNESKDNFALRNVKFKTAKQKEMYDTILKNEITFVKGPAGTGKTYIALYAALELVLNKRHNISDIILTKPIIEASKTIGALPGEINEKTAAYFSHFYENLHKICGSQASTVKQKYIREVVLNYVRGYTFTGKVTSNSEAGSICILDEAQNTTITEMKTYISRKGEYSKLIIMGDPDQIDLKSVNHNNNGLSDAIIRLSGIDRIGFVEFNEEEIVRDPLLKEIMNRYKNSY